MSRSNIDKPFYVDVGTSIVAIRCQSNRDVLILYDYVHGGHHLIAKTEGICARMNEEVTRTRVREGGRAMNDYEKIASEIGKVKSAVCGISLDGLDEGTREIVNTQLGEAAMFLNSAQGYLEWKAEKESEMTK